MDPNEAIRVLNSLLEELTVGNVVEDSHATDSWSARVRAVFVRALGQDSHLVDKLDAVWFSPGFYYDGQPESEFTEARRNGVKSASALIDAAIFDLGLSIPASAANGLTPENYDAGLWAHVGSLVTREDWALLASAVATYVEDRVRTWSGLPAGTVGHGLYANALGPNGALPLGGTGTQGESEGWKYVGMGLAQAVGNVDRHRITSRSDLRQYAIGVLGLGSLLLTQIRWEHPGRISNVDDR